MIYTDKELFALIKPIIASVPVSVDMGTTDKKAVSDATALIIEIIKQDREAHGQTETT